MEKVNVIIGRFQPMTLGHIKGAEQVYKEYKLRTVYCIVETPESKLDFKHPFPSDLIIKNNQDIKESWFAGIYPIKNADIGKIAAVCREHDFEPIMWTCGTDRADDYRKQAVPKYIEMYNLDPDFHIEEIHRTDDDISATKVRQAIKNNDFDTYKRMMPRWSWGDFDSYKPYIKESRLISLRDYIVEGFFKNIGADDIIYKYIFDYINDNFRTPGTSHKLKLRQKSGYSTSYLEFSPTSIPPDTVPILKNLLYITNLYGGFKTKISDFVKFLTKKGVEVKQSKYAAGLNNICYQWLFGYDNKPIFAFALQKNSDTEFFDRLYIYIYDIKLKSYFS